MLQDLVKLFTPDVLTLLVILAMFVVVFLLNLLFAAMRKTEFFKQNEMFIVAVGQKALEFIIHAEYGNEYVAKSDEYETKAEERVKAGGYYVDPRMLFVIDKLELFINEKFNTTLEFDDLLTIAEGKYRQVKEDPNNTLLNS